MIDSTRIFLHTSLAEQKVNWEHTKIGQKCHLNIYILNKIHLTRVVICPSLALLAKDTYAGNVLSDSASRTQCNFIPFSTKPCIVGLQNRWSENFVLGRLVFRVCPHAGLIFNNNTWTGSSTVSNHALRAYARVYQLSYVSNMPT